MAEVHCLVDYRRRVDGVYVKSVRYPDGGGLTAVGRDRREQVCFRVAGAGGLR
jgi:hypothetical protein